MSSSRPGILRHLTVVVAVAASAGCADGTSPSANYQRAYRMAPYTFFYHFVDSSGGLNFELRWLTDLTYLGSACLFFAANDSLGFRAGQDSSGIFAFQRYGVNVGSIERRRGSVIDTVAGYWFHGGEGTGGRYHQAADGRITYNWRDGVPGRYFDSTAVHQLLGDTIWSTAELSHRADSIHVSWRLAWIRDPC